MIKTICGNEEFIKDLKNKKAHFLLGASVTKTCEIEGITQAGIPGFIPLTPVLDAEFISDGKVYSMPNIAETPKGVPTPALITRAVHQINPFSKIDTLDLGLLNQPKIENCITFQIEASNAISEGAKIDAKSIFEKGIAFGNSFKHAGKYVIVGESAPSGTTTAKAAAKALGYQTDELFSSSFKDVPVSIKDAVIQEAMQLIKDKNDLFEILGAVGDNMLLFTAGFVMSMSKRSQVVLAGGTQMAAVLLILDKLQQNFEAENIALITTKWVYEDQYSDIGKILDQINSFKPNAFYSNFSFAASNVPPLKLYDEGEAKEGVGAGGAIAYGYLNGLREIEIVKEVEKFFS